MAYEIETIEGAVIDRLAPLKDSGVRTIGTFQEELTEESLKKLLTSNQPPAVFVVWAGSQYQSHGGRKMEHMALSIFISTRSLRSEQEARHGGAEIGAYAIMRQIRDLLTGQTLLPAMLPVEIIGEESIWRGNGISLYVANYLTGQGHQYPAA